MEDSQATPTSGFDFLLIKQDAPGMNPNEDSRFQAGEHHIVETFYPHELNIALTVDSTDSIHFELQLILLHLENNYFDRVTRQMTVNAEKMLIETETKKSNERHY